MTEIAAILGVIVAGLGWLLRRAWKHNAKIEDQLKRASQEAAAKRLRDETARDIRRDSDEALVDRLSPPSR